MPPSEAIGMGRFSEGAEAASAVSVRAGEMFSLSSTRAGDEQLLAMRGDLDLASAPALSRELERVAKTNVRRITVDLSGLIFIDSSGLRALLLASRSRANGDRLTIRRAPGFVRRILALTGTAGLFVLPREGVERSTSSL